jgi:ABC-type phosphate/phosphonate transport system substrate-binding protein
VTQADQVAKPQMRVVLGPRKETVLLGAVAANGEVITNWNAFRDWLTKRGLPFDYILYTSYERMNAALVDGDIDVAYNTPLGWVQARRLAESKGKKVEPIIMRDIDFDLTSAVITRADSHVKTVADLKGKVVAVGSPDSVESTIMPLSTIQDAGLAPGENFEVLYCSSVLGTHGGDQQGEVDAVQALLAGKADAACLATGNYEDWVRKGTIPANATRVVAHTAKYDHCNMTVGKEGASPELIQRFQELFLEMSYDDPEIHSALDYEYVKQWKPARTSHYASLEHAVDYWERM